MMTIDDKFAAELRRLGIDPEDLPLTEEELHRKLHDRELDPHQRADLKVRLANVRGLK